MREINHNLPKIAVRTKTTIARFVGSIPVIVARPKAVFVKLDLLLRYACKKHSPQSAIANGQCLIGPLLRRLCVPKQFSRWQRCQRKRDQKDKQR